MIVLDHPLINQKLTIIRNEKTSNQEFRRNILELSKLMVYEVTKDLEEESIKIKTPIAEASFKTIKNKIILIPVLRAGLGMLDGFLDLIPNASVGYIGVKRNEETLKPIEYFVKLPKIDDNTDIIVLDPMLATGGSASYAIDIIKKNGGKKIIFASIVSAPEGIELIEKNHPDVKLYTCAKDIKLNDIGYIVPGLGDCGDRLFGTDDYKQ